MAKLLSYFDLCSISDHNEFHGLSEDNEPGTVINTLGRNTFLLIQLSNQQQVHSWNVLEKLTNKVVYDFKSQKYVAVFFNRFVRLWTSNVTDVNKVKKLKIPKPVHDLLSYQRRDTIVLYKDGTCESLELCLETRKDDRSQSAGQPKAIVGADDTILSAAHFQLAAGEDGTASAMLTYFVRHTESSSSVDLVFHKLDAETLTASGPVQRLRLVRPNNVHLIGYVVVDGPAHPSLMTLWSDKRIFSMPLRFDDSVSQSIVPGNVVAMLNMFRVDQPLTIHGVGKDCVAIYGANAQQEGSSLVLYNTRFNVAQSKQFFKVYFNNARLWVIGKHIFLAYGQTLACVAYRIVREQLVDMLGSQRSNDFSTVIDRDTINEEYALEEAFRYDATAHSDDDDDVDSDGEAITADVAAVDVAAQTVGRVQDDLRSLYDHNVLWSLQRSEIFLSDTLQTQIGSNVRDTVFAVDEVQLLVAEMEKGGAGEVEITERLVPLLIRARASDELVRCLRKYSNVSDRQLVRALKYFMNMNEADGETSAQTVSNVQRQQLTIDERNAPFVNAVLSCSFAADQLLEPLRTHLDFSEVLCVLKHIMQLLGSDRAGLEAMVQFGDAFSEDLQLYAWFAAIFDAHYQSFVLSRNADLLRLIVQWQEFVNEQIESTRKLKSLSADLYNLVNGKSPAADKQSSKWYSVEIIKLD